MRALIVDDQPMLLEMMRHKIQKAGFDVDAVNNGTDAIKVFERTDPDLVITNLLIPEKSGLEIIKYIRDKGKSVPIIVASGVQSEEMMLKVFELGADDFICKPFKPIELIVKAKRYFMGGTLVKESNIYHGLAM